MPNGDPHPAQGIIDELQSLLRTNGRLKLEFQASVSKLLRDHDIFLDEDLGVEEEEIDAALEVITVGLDPELGPGDPSEPVTTGGQ